MPRVDNSDEEGQPGDHQQHQHHNDTNSSKDQPSDRGSHRLAFHHRLLFSLGEERNLVVDVLENDEDGGFTRKLLSSVVLRRILVRSFQTHVIHDHLILNLPRHVS